MSDYGSDVDDNGSVGSLYDEVTKQEESEKRQETTDVDDDRGEDNVDVIDRVSIYEKFKHSIFQDASNNKLFVLVLKKAK
tara:strand:+ start:148 stop:387 length:240 start_codon:yes stop_codon:yes gene_type:complete